MAMFLTDRSHERQGERGMGMMVFRHSTAVRSVRSIILVSRRPSHQAADGCAMPVQMGGCLLLNISVFVNSINDFFVSLFKGKVKS